VAIEGLSIRPYFDHNLSPRFAHDLRHHGYDAVHAQEVGNDRASDEVHLAWAANHGRTIATNDLDDFPVLAQRWVLAGRSHAGIILVVGSHRRPYGETLRRFLTFLDTVTADEMVNLVRWL
jgi:predicted nuclease of predicted toxin-antitoxin system